MNINNLLLIQAVKEYRSIPHSIDTLYNCLSPRRVLPQFLLIPELFFQSNIEIESYEQISSYVSESTEWYGSLNSYNESEQAWYTFYTILSAYKWRDQDIQTICNSYNSLPILQTNKKYMQWISLETKKRMLFYYVSANIDIDSLAAEIEAYPEEIQYAPY